MVKSIAEIVDAAAKAKRVEHKVKILQDNNTVALRNILICTYDTNIEFLVPNEAPPYTPSKFEDSQGMLLREARKLKYFVKGMWEGEIHPIKRERLFIQLLESVDAADAKLLVNMIEQKPIKGLTAETINKAFGPIIKAKAK